MRERVRRAFVENAPIKLAALLLALALFFIVRGDRDAVTTVRAKVVYLHPADRVLMTEPVNELRISVRGPLNRIGHLDARDLDAVRVDLRDAHDGELRFGEEMLRLPPGLRAEAMSPQSMQLLFEPRVDREVEVQPVIAGDPASGFRVVRSSVDPARVLASGARSVVERTARAPTRPLRIAGASESVRGEVDLAPPPQHVEWRTSGPITVTVEVAPTLGEKLLRAVAVRVVGADRIDATVEPPEVDVVLRGPAEALARVVAGRPELLVDATAEAARAPGVARKRVDVVGLPAGVAAEVRPDSVTLLTRRRREQP
jgi:YbbR domain-containing protein